MMNEFEERLAALREQFLRNASGKLEILDVSIARLAEDRTDSAMLDRAMRAFHFFGGIGTTYGFPEVTRAGRAAETICDQVAADARMITDDEIAGLQKELAAIRHAMELDRAPEPAAERILLLDEDPEETAFISMVLESVGYEVRVCEDRKYLRADLRTFSPHLLLATEGCGVFRAARDGEPAFARTLVISDPVDADTPPETSFSLTLRRPLTPALLISTVTASLGETPPPMRD